MSRKKTRGISPVGKEKVYGGNDLPKSQVLSSEWKTERVREDASGDREDGEEADDELPAIKVESVGVVMVVVCGTMTKHVITKKGYTVSLITTPGDTNLSDAAVNRLLYYMFSYSLAGDVAFNLF